MMATTKVGIYHDPRKQRPWIVRWFGEYEPTAERRRRYSKGFRLKRDAERLQAQKQAEFEKGTMRDRPGEVTLRAFCEKYLSVRTHEWREKTRRHIDELRRRLLDHFGPDTSLRSVTSDRAARFWSSAKMVRKGSEGDDLSRFSRNRLLRDTKTMFKYAVEWGYLASNPFTGIKMMRVPKQNRRAWHYVTPDDYRALLRAAPDLRWKVLYALAYTSGARFGELFNLTVENVDFRRGRLLIRSRPASAELPPFQIKDQEDREIPLPRHTIRLLEGWLRTRPTGSPLIVVSPERYQRILELWRTHRAAGTPWINDFMVNNLLTSIRRHARWAGLKLAGPLTMHGFRKSCGQNWANHLPMNVVKELMGHADIGTTAEFYSKVTLEHEAQAQWVIQTLTIGSSRERTDAGLTPGPKMAATRKVG